MKNIFLQIGLIGILLLSVGYVDAQRYVDSQYIYVRDTVGATEYINRLPLDMTYSNYGNYSTGTYQLYTGITENHLVPTLLNVYASSQAFNSLRQWNKNNLSYYSMVGNDSSEGLAIVNNIAFQYNGTTLRSSNITDWSTNWVVDTSACFSSFDYHPLSYREDELFLMCDGTIDGYMQFNSDTGVLENTANITYNGDGVYIRDIDIDNDYIYSVFVVMEETTYGVGVSGYDGVILDYNNLTLLGYVGEVPLSMHMRIIGNYIYVLGKHLNGKNYISVFNKNLDVVNNITVLSSAENIVSVDTDYTNYMYMAVHSTDSNDLSGLYRYDLESLRQTLIPPVPKTILGRSTIAVGISSYKGGSGEGQSFSDIEMNNYVDGSLVNTAEVVCYLYLEDVLISIEANDVLGKVYFDQLFYDDYTYICELDSSAYPNVVGSYTKTLNITVDAPNFYFVNDWVTDDDERTTGYKNFISLFLNSSRLPEVRIVLYQNNTEINTVITSSEGNITYTGKVGDNYYLLASKYGFRDVNQTFYIRSYITEEKIYMPINYSLQESDCGFYGFFNATFPHQYRLKYECTSLTDWYDFDYMNGNYNFSVPDGDICSVDLVNQGDDFVYNFWTGKKVLSPNCTYEYNHVLGNLTTKSFYFHYQDIIQNDIKVILTDWDNNVNITKHESNNEDAFNDLYTFNVYLNGNYSLYVVDGRYEPEVYDFVAISTNLDNHLIYLEKVEDACLMLVKFKADDFHNAEIPDLRLYIDVESKDMTTGAKYSTKHIRGSDRDFVLGIQEYISVSCTHLTQLDISSIYYEDKKELADYVTQGTSLLTITLKTLIDWDSVSDVEIIREINKYINPKSIFNDWDYFKRAFSWTFFIFFIGSMGVIILTPIAIGVLLLKKIGIIK